MPACTVGAVRAPCPAAALTGHECPGPPDEEHGRSDNRQRAIATTDVERERTVNLADAITRPPAGLFTETTTGKSPEVRANTSTSTDWMCWVSCHGLRVGAVKECELVARQVEHDRHRIRHLAHESYRDRGGLRGETDGVDGRQ